MSENEEARAANQGVVLVIEDSSTQALHLQALLEEEGLKVTVAYDGQTGLQMARELLPDVIVLDLELPEMSGFQVCRRLKDARETADIPVVMLTRHDDQEVAALGLQLGAVDYIPKDAFSDAALLETLRRMRLSDADKQ
jgi:DNA-binding response OmpR family regulator